MVSFRGTDLCLEALQTGTVTSQGVHSVFIMCCQLDKRLPDPNCLPENLATGIAFWQTRDAQKCTYGQGTFFGLLFTVRKLILQNVDVFSKCGQKMSNYRYAVTSLV